jgi:hypothetical protein
MANALILCELVVGFVGHWMKLATASTLEISVYPWMILFESQTVTGRDLLDSVALALDSERRERHPRYSS